MQRLLALQAENIAVRILSHIFLSKPRNRGILIAIDIVDFIPNRRAFEEARQSSSKARFGTGKVLHFLTASRLKAIVFGLRIPCVLQWRLRHEAGRST